MRYNELTVSPVDLLEKYAEQSTNQQLMEAYGDTIAQGVSVWYQSRTGKKVPGYVLNKEFHYRDKAGHKTIPLSMLKRESFTRRVEQTSRQY